MDGSKNKIHVNLEKLIEQKSKRDEKKFTVYQLAKALKMPHSMILKLMHKCPDRRVNNPRVDTLLKIVNFFKEDGFEITIDHLINGL